MSLDAAVIVVTAFVRRRILFCRSLTTRSVRHAQAEKNRRAVTRRVLFASLPHSLSFVATSAHAGSSARDDDGSRISVTAVAGDVDVTMAGNAVDRSAERHRAPAGAHRDRSRRQRRAHASGHEHQRRRTTPTSRFPPRPSTATSSPDWSSTAATSSTTSRRATSASCASRRRCSWRSSKARSSTSPCSRTARRSRCSRAASRFVLPTTATSCS